MSGTQLYERDRRQSIRSRSAGTYVTTVAPTRAISGRIRESNAKLRLMGVDRNIFVAIPPECAFLPTRKAKIVTTKELTIRPQTAADCKELFRLETEIFDCELVMPRSFRRFVSSPTIESFVAEVDGELVGYATVMFRPRSLIARIYSIAINPAIQRMGIGCQLLEACESSARSRGSSTLRLEVKMDNAKAIAFYEKYGYQRYGIRPGFYEDGTDALLLRKQL